MSLEPNLMKGGRGPQRGKAGATTSTVRLSRRSSRVRSKGLRTSHKEPLDTKLLKDRPMIAICPQVMRDNEKRSIILTEAKIREQAIRPFFGRALREVRERSARATGHRSSMTLEQAQSPGGGHDHACNCRHALRSGGLSALRDDGSIRRSGATG